MSNSQTASQLNYILGLDLGTASIGWSVVRIGPEDKDKNYPDALVNCGARCFEAGVEGDITQGKDASRAVVRRQRRAIRRQIQRRSRRRRKLLHVLQTAALLPAGVTRKPADIHQYLLILDEALRSKWIGEKQRVEAHVWPYRLRAAALDNKLEPFELGRALLHLAQRRGFLSNRKTDRNDKETGPVKEGIATLRNEILASNSRTLGEHFSKLDPEQHRIRQRWTHRDMYKSEFDQIVAAQKNHHPEILTDELMEKLRKAIFAQRPLKSSRHLIGFCEAGLGKRRAAVALPVAQRFRLLAAVNNLQIIEPDGTKRALIPEERDKLIHTLEHDGDQTFAAIRTLLGLQKSKTAKDKSTGQKITTLGHTFNLEHDGGETKMIGNRTASKLRPVFADWDQLTAEKQEEIVHTLCAMERPELVEKIATEQWGLTKNQARELSEVTLEDGRARYCRQVLATLVQRMEEGLHYMTALNDEFPKAKQEAMDRLPKVIKALPDLKNPAVCRVLSELRKVVNALLKQYGKPALIRIELARDLKNPRKKREEMWKNMRAQEKVREDAKTKILKEIGKDNARRADVEKVLLAEECNWQCPYTGQPITMSSLFGAAPLFDVEHIIPESISLDNSFLNKTLCYNEENKRKNNRTPYETYDQSSQQWHEILCRVRKFNGHSAKAKLETFQMTPELVQQQLW